MDSAAPRITVIGTGYVGAAQAACLAELGFGVLGVDTSPDRIESLWAARPGIYEAGLEESLRRGVASGRLTFTTSYPQAAEFGDIHFLCVGTPQRPGSRGADLSQLCTCLDSLGPLLTRPCLVVGKSTVPVGTAAALTLRLARAAPAGAAAELAWNPEFLREGHAVEDTLRPDRIVIGVQSARAEATLRRVYAKALADGVPLVATNMATAELAKMAANAFLATKISFINAMAEVCEPAGADVSALAEAIGYDPRIGSAGMRPGLGFGGSCLPKDIRAFGDRAAELGVEQAVRFLSEVDMINQRRRLRMVDLACELASGSLADRAVGVLGLAFKPGSDDIRDSPALDVAASLHSVGAEVTAFDPAAMANARRVCPQLRYADSVIEAARRAEVLLVLTDWPQFAAVDPAEAGAVVARRVIADGRHALDAARWRAAGWYYRSLGSPAGAAADGDGAPGPAASARLAAASTSPVLTAARTWSARAE
jgi:UDPglucose 6-dehydrogenase